MTLQPTPEGERPASPEGWYARSPQDVAMAFEVDPDAGLPTARVTELLAAYGPNALPEEKPSPAWRRFIDQYRSYMQIILVAAAVVSFRIEDAILPYVVASDAKLVDGKVVGDPTEGALLVLGHKAGLDVEATRERLPRLATLPFDPDHKLMATFHSATDDSGRPVVRCFVKGAAPAVMSRAATALSAGTTVPWDGDLLSLVTDLRMTSLVGMIDPPRGESRDAVADAQSAHIRVRMVTGDDVTTGAAIARQLGIPGEAVLGADFAALPEEERLARIDGIGVVGRVAPEHKVLLADTLKKKGEVVA
ncbi:cation-transporting P-type ATPase [Actinacidiphila glaucinigra]